jgi:8-oxo-dGTP pyrophosphatase MutT (NUDIX family)
VTGSAVIVHPPTGRVLLRWHERMGSWLQVGGHGDPGETDPLLVARREATEETGLSDLVPWPEPAGAGLVHVVVVPVPAGRGEPAHEHADLRFVLATEHPDDVRPESPSAPLRWLTLADALDAVAEDNLRLTLERVAALGLGA